MSPEKQRIAIAEALGKCIFRGTGVRETRDGTRSEFCLNCGKPHGYHELDDYLSDLNAMHEAETKLTAFQWSKYVTSLCGLTSDRSGEGLVFSTAAQRAEAFLKTIGKWDDQI